MKERRSWEWRIGTWLILALAVAVVANLVWELVQPLIVPACFVIVAGLALTVVIRWWFRRNRW